MTTPDPSAPAPVGAGAAEPSTGRTVLTYSLLRFGLFVGAMIIMLPFVRGRDGFYLALIISALASGVASYFLLRSQRAPLAVALDRRLAASRAASARKAAVEDAADDAARSTEQ